MSHLGFLDNIFILGFTGSSFLLQIMRQQHPRRRRKVEKGERFDFTHDLQLSQSSPGNLGGSYFGQKVKRKIS